MNWIRYLLLFTIGILVFSFIRSYSRDEYPTEKKTIHLYDISEKKLVGNATILMKSRQTVIDVTILMSPQSEQGVSIIEGTCAQMGPIVYHLNPIRFGWANWTLDIPMNILIGKNNHAIVLHSKLDSESDIIACGAL